MNDPDGKPSYREIARWSSSIAGYWKFLAAELKLPGETIRNIAKSLALYPTLEDQALQMLQEWLETGNATYRNMAEALRTLDKGDLADKICPPQGDSLGKAQHERKHSPSVNPAANSGEGSKRIKTGSPSDRELNNLARKIPRCWDDLSIELGVPLEVIDNIDSNTPYQGSAKTARRALVAWRGLFGSEATYEKLADGLEKVGRGDLVNEFCIDHMDQKIAGVSFGDQEQGTPVGASQVEGGRKPEGQKTEYSAVPIEIRARGNQALEAYQRALKDGKCYDRRVPVMIVGQDRTGKTSLLKSLKGEKFEQDQKSTEGIARRCTFAKDVWKDEEWTGGHDNRFASEAARIVSDNFESESLKEVPERPSKKIQKRKVDVDPSKRPASMNREEQEDNSPPAQPENVATSSRVVPDSIPDYVLEAMEKGVQDLGTDPELIFWDFAGQSVFYTTHPFFLSRKAIYIVTFDLSKGLDDTAVPSVKIGDEEEEELPSERDMTNMDYINYWLSSIHAFSQDDNAPESTSDDLPEKLPPVFLVGTHADNVANSELSKIFRQLRKNLNGKSHESHLMFDDFAVNNTLSGSKKKDEQVEKLLGRILEVARHLPHLKEEIPLVWLNVERELRQLEEGGTKFTDLQTVNQKTRMHCEVQREDDLKTVVDFFHDRHVVLHYDTTPELNELVVLSHQWLTDIFKDVITVKSKTCPLRWKANKCIKDHWNALGEGELHRKLVEYVWKDHIQKEKTIDSLLEMLQKFSLICKWRKQDGQEVYLVPPMLESVADSDIRKCMKSDEVPVLVIRFETTYVPFGLFPRLLIRCLNESAGKRKCKIRKNSGCFLWGEGGRYKLLVASRLHQISCVVTTQRTCESGLVTVCRNVCKFMKKQLEEMKAENLWWKGMAYTLSFECPVCSQNVKPNINEPNQQKGVHYLDEKEILDDLPLVCDKCDGAEMKDIPRDPYRYWFEIPDMKDEEGHTSSDLGGDPDDSNTHFDHEEAHENEYKKKKKRNKKPKGKYSRSKDGGGGERKRRKLKRPKVRDVGSGQKRAENRKRTRKHKHARRSPSTSLEEASTDDSDTSKDSSPSQKRKVGNVAMAHEEGHTSSNFGGDSDDNNTDFEDEEAHADEYEKKKKRKKEPKRKYSRNKDGGGEERERGKLKRTQVRDVGSGQKRAENRKRTRKQKHARRSPSTSLEEASTDNSEANEDSSPSKKRKVGNLAMAHEEGRTSSDFAHEKPASRVLLFLAKNIPDYWRSLGIELGLEPEDLDDITGMKTMNAPRDMAFEMLKRWRKQSRAPSNEEVVRALKAQCLVGIAKQYCQKAKEHFSNS